MLRIALSKRILVIKSNSNAFSISFPSFLRERRVSSIQKNAQRQNFEQVRVSSIHETPVTLSDTNRLKPSKERLFLATHVDLFVFFLFLFICLWRFCVLKKKKKKKKKDYTAALSLHLNRIS